MSFRRLSVVFAALALVTTACGGGDDDTKGAEARTVEIDMVDIAFEPTTVAVSTGETVRFVFTNKGKVAHDAFLGDADAQMEHADEMRMGDENEHGSEHGPGDTNGITVDPGDTGELTHTFDESRAFEIGCHQPGHYEAGMKVAVEVS